MKFKLEAKVSKQYDSDFRKVNKTTCSLSIQSKDMWIYNTIFTKEWQVDVEDDEAIAQTMDEFSEKLSKLLM